jgi:leucyl-tRNA synthetase
MQRYNPKDIEPRWQRIWDETDVYTADLQSSKPKYMAMSMFNYPSGAGIHIGHAMNYTISDVKARFKRQQGYESYHPVGWDAFGLPAENYAIKAGVSPQESMATIIPMYHKQYKAMGWSNDWEKEISTHLPQYYKWTQWIFSEMCRQGLAYQDSRLQWWCSIDNTVLANEQVIDGKCWRHDGPNDPLVQKKEVKQWFFKITDYADELLEAIDDLDWTESVKLAQKNWIGRSEGMIFTAPVKDSELEIQTFSAHFEAFRADTFVVIAPDHPFLKKLVKGTPDEQKILDFAAEMVRKRDLQGYADEEHVKGIFTGRYIVDPVGNGDLPIWVASYALADYGTGIVKCSAHDERDFRFAKKYNLHLKPVLFPADEKEAENVRKLEYCYTDMQHGILTEPEAFAGKVSGQSRHAITKYLEEHKLAVPKVSYKMRDWSVSRQRYWGAPIPIIHCPKCGPQLVPDEDLPVILPELKDFESNGDGRSALARAKDWLIVDCPQCSGPAERETDTLDTYICSSWYMLRYLDPHNQEKIFDSDIVNHWLPIDFYNGADHATAHLLYARFVTRFLSKIGLVKNPEPFKKMLYNGKVLAADGTMFSKSKGNGVDPLEVIDSGYGADALRTYLMFAAPLELGAHWDPRGVPGTFRFLTRLWNLVQEYSQTEKIELSDSQSLTILQATHRMIQKMTIDIEADRYNTAIAAAMTCLNDFYKLKNDAFGKSETWQFALESLVTCIAPFAPHIAEELWQQLGHTASVHKDSWPIYNKKYLARDTLTIVVQVNGKLRAEIQVAVDAEEQTIVDAARANQKVASYLAKQKIEKTIFVPNKLVNFVI